MVLAVLGGVALAVVETRRFLYTSNYFAIERLEFPGAPEPLARELATIAELKTDESNVNLFRLSTEDARQRLELHPRVARARLTKVWPDTLEANVLTRKPMAVVVGRELTLVDRDGFALGPPNAELGDTLDLAFISGIHPSEIVVGARVGSPPLWTILELIERLRSDNPDLAKRIGEWHIDHNDAITARLIDDVEIRFGRGELGRKMVLLEMFIRKFHEEAFNSCHIDLRFDGQIVYRPR